MFAQSLVPEHAELFLLLSMVVPVPWLERVPTYKEQQDTLKDKDLSSIGFLGYPLLQTADVAMYDARFVPVGDDQVAHLELAREAVRRFNNFFGDVLVEPQPLRDDLQPPARARWRQEDEQEPRQYDPPLGHSRRSPQEGHEHVHGPEAGAEPTCRAPSKAIRCSPITTRSIRTREEVDDLKARYRAGRVGDVEVKKKLAVALNAHLDPIRERRAAVLARPDHVREILFEGSRRARAVAAQTMARVRDAVKITYK